MVLIYSNLYNKKSAEYRMFVPEDTCDNVHSLSRRMLMVSPEPGFWIHAVRFN